MLPNITDFDFEGIKRVFDQQIRDGLHHGAQLVVRRLGDVLIDFHAGFSDASKRIPITSETNFLTFSLTKPYTSVCIFKLVEEREINLEDPVGYYWPEFSCRGKEEMTIRQVLLHQSGLPKNRLVYQILNAPDWEKIIDDLAVQKPDFPPGTKTAYQLLNFGFILGEIIQRVTGSPVDEFLRQEFLAPLGLTRTTMRVLDFQDEQFARLSSRTLDHQVVAWIFNSKS